MAVTPYLLVVNPAVPAKSAEGAGRADESQPGKLNYASAGVGSTTHLAMEMLKSCVEHLRAAHPLQRQRPGGHRGDRRPGRDPVRQPAGGAAAREVAAACGALAVGTPKRSPSLPDVPTVAESGYPGFDASLWLAIMAPAGHAAAGHRSPAQGDRCRGRRSPTPPKRSTRHGAEPLTSTPAELAAMIRDGVPQVRQGRQGRGRQAGVGIALVGASLRQIAACATTRIKAAHYLSALSPAVAWKPTFYSSGSTP